MPKIVTITLNPALDLATEVARMMPDVKLRCTAARADPGGGGLNVARAIRQLGGQSEAFAALGGGAGAEVRALLEARGLSVRSLGVTQPTRQNMAVTETATGRQYRFILPGAAWSDVDCVRAAEAIRAGTGPGDWLVPSGSLPMGVPEDYFLSLNEELAPRGVRMLLDISGPALRAAAEAPKAPLWTLRMDSHEAEDLAAAPLETPAATARFARDLIARGVAGQVLMARQAEGTVAISAEGAWLCPAPQVPVLSRTGAGDSFVAGFLLATGRGADLPVACAFGVAAASSAVSTPDTALCDRIQTEALAASITPRPL